jgi:hypothetical protein
MGEARAVDSGPQVVSGSPAARVVQAQCIRAAKERSARAGIHQGPAPLGYVRVARPPTASGPCPPDLLLLDPVYAPIVREIFARYAAGGWSHISLVEWLNGDPAIPTPPGRRTWQCSTIQALLRNPFYCGLVRYNQRPEGRYASAAPGSAFLAPGRHPALIDQETFARAAARRDAAFTRPSYARHAPAVGDGIFVCAACGGPMTPSHQEPGLFYRCSWRQRRRADPDQPHEAPGYVGNLAEEALLREVRRLQAGPWTSPGETGWPPTHGTAEGSAMDGTPSTAWWAIAQVRYAWLVATPITSLVDQLLERSDTARLRQLVRDVVASARIVERVPERRPVWLRAEVTWQPWVQALLDCGAVRLNAQLPPPEQSPQAVRHREAQRRYSARRPRSGRKPA